MNKLTTISTIKKAAPLALLAVVLSGSAFAGPGKGKGDREKGPKLSLDVHTLCKLDDTYPAAPVLHVTTTITDSSGDNGDGGMTITSKKAYPAFKFRGPFMAEGDGVELVEDDDYYTVDTYVAELHLCDLGLQPREKATAVSIVEISDGTKFSSNCENIFVDEDGDGIDDDGIDQSNIDLSGVYCSSW